MFKILTEGFSKVTGDFGGVYFEDGLTVENLTVAQINKLGAIIHLEKVLEDGSSFQVGPASTGLQATEYMANLIAERDMAYQASVAPSVHNEINEGEVVTTVSEGFKYTRAYLESIADKSGMAGLRELAPDDIKAKSVKALIDGLLTLTIPV